MSVSQSSNPKRPSFVHWLRASGQLTPEELGALIKEWNRVKPGSDHPKVYTTDPVTWDQFVASKYPKKVLAYQAYLRLIGAAPDFRKE